MNDWMDVLVEKFPTWLIWILAFIVLVLRWGPGFLMKYLEVSQKFRDKSDAIKNEYIADLEKQVERLKKKLNNKSNQDEQN